MREDYSTASWEKGFYISETVDELNSLYDEVSTAQELENDWTEEK